MKKTDVLVYFETQKAISEALTQAGYRISQPAVSKWGETVPEIPARILSDITKGKLAFIESEYRDKPAA